MDFNKKWSHYVLHNIDSQKLDQMVINLKCEIPGYRANNKKSVKTIPKALKVSTINKKIFNEKKWCDEITRLHKKVLEKKEVKSYLEMSPTEFLSQIETFKAQEDKEVQIGVVNYFLQSSITLGTEKERIVEHFNIEPLEKDNRENEVIISQPLIKEAIVDKAGKEENKAGGKEDKSKDEKNKLENEEDKGEEEQGSLSKNQVKKYRTLEHVHEELKKKKREQEEEIKKLNCQLKELHTIYKEKEEGYIKEVKNLELELEQLNKDYESLEQVNKKLERKLEQTEAGMPYIFIGSSFIKKKVQNIKEKQYPSINVIYTSTKQWQNGLAKAKNEVAEVYAFFYDIEWLKREQLYKEYEEKLKVFKTDELFYEYITQHWED